MTERDTGAVVSIDTRTLRTTRTRFVDSLRMSGSPALLATDGSSLFVNVDGPGLTRLDARTLTPEPHVLAPTEHVLSLQADRSGRALYVLAPNGLLVLAPDGRVVERWAAPGDATTMAPPTAPGHGTYLCRVLSPDRLLARRRIRERDFGIEPGSPRARS